MTANQYGSGIMSVALITISLDLSVADEIADSVLAMSWAVHRADCEGYISSTKRPPLPQPVKSANACIAVIDFDRDVEQAVAAASYVQELFSGKAALVAVSASQNPEILLRAMRCGCTEFIGGEFDPAEFAQTLTRLHQQWSTKSARNMVRGSVITFFGAKGGVGTTTLAVHLAMYLVQCHGKKTLLIDNHPQLGHACIYLGLDGSRYHFHELVRNLTRLDSDLLRGYIATHSSGLEVLASPDVVGGMKTCRSGVDCPDARFSARRVRLRHRRLADRPGRDQSRDHRDIQSCVPGGDPGDWRHPRPVAICGQPVAGRPEH